MILNQYTLSARDAESATVISKGLAERCVQNAVNFQADSQRIKRKKYSECKACFYFCRHKMAGAACSSRPCGLCGKSVDSGSTDVSRLCLDCGHKHKLCVVCGGDIELKVYRRKWDLPEPVETQACDLCQSFFSKASLTELPKPRNGLRMLCKSCASL